MDRLQIGSDIPTDTGYVGVSQGEKLRSSYSKKYINQLQRQRGMREFSGFHDLHSRDGETEAHRKEDISS